MISTQVPSPSVHPPTGVTHLFRMRILRTFFLAAQSSVDVLFTAEVT